MREKKSILCLRALAQWMSCVLFGWKHSNSVGICVSLFLYIHLARSPFSSFLSVAFIHSHSNSKLISTEMSSLSWVLLRVIINNNSTFVVEDSNAHAPFFRTSIYSTHSIHTLKQPKCMQPRWWTQCAHEMHTNILNFMLTILYTTHI